MFLNMHLHSLINSNGTETRVTMTGLLIIKYYKDFASSVPPTLAAVHQFLSGYKSLERKGKRSKFTM